MKPGNKHKIAAGAFLAGSLFFAGLAYEAQANRSTHDTRAHIAANGGDVATASAESQQTDDYHRKAVMYLGAAAADLAGASVLGIRGKQLAEGQRDNSSPPH